MARRPAYAAYDYARGDGWILTSLGPTDRSVTHDPLYTVVMYYTDEEHIEEHETRDVDHLLRQYLDIGAHLGSYPGASPEPFTDFEEQPRSVRMQRHATDIYEATKHARGMSPTIAIRAAEEFGSTWAEKDADEWQDRVQMVGEGRARRIVDEL